MAVYNYERTLLAMQCAEALKLKPISPIVSEYALKISDLPHDTNLSTVRKENSLLQMGLVYCDNTMLKFIDSSGHTCLLPATPVFIEELEKCGYKICEHGKLSPDFGYPDSNMLDPLSEEYISQETEAIAKETEFRELMTLPEELARKVSNTERTTMPEHSKFAYDVLQSDYSNIPGYNMEQEIRIVEKMGYESPIARKFMTLVGYAGDSLGTSTRNVSDIETFILYAAKDRFLNDELYFDPDTGLYSYYTSSKEEYRNKNI